MDQVSPSTASSTPGAVLSYITPIGESSRHSQRCLFPLLQVPARQQGPTIAASCPNARLPLAKVPCLGPALSLAPFFSARRLPGLGSTGTTSGAPVNLLALHVLSLPPAVQRRELCMLA